MILYKNNMIKKCAYMAFKHSFYDNNYNW